uniref:Uncharacterized protein n=1 Tax=Hemiselmis tepida TaxID=464990 RepID=A0A7S0VUS0_9CRYP|mmetsp:Transcript_21579/g.54458  ORF Transcript_21579/g.54458 Transcript_21579/m.54458 type:complete len:282 (+) Transcript_21579:24-869(+)
MNKSPSRSIVNEVYSHVINVTVESLRKHIEKSKKKKFSRFDIPNELKSRWQARLNCLFYSLEGSWLKIQETSTKFNEFPKKIERPFYPLTVINFSLVCNLSWDFFQFSKTKNEKISGFKSWVWNCLVSQMINEGVYPSQSMKTKMKKKKKTSLEKFFSSPVTIFKYENNWFNKYGYFLEENLDFFFDSNKNSTVVEKKFFQNEKDQNFSNLVDSLGSELDEDLESYEIGEVEEKTPKNFILAVTEKVYRRNTKWRIILKDGILHLNEKDLLFNLCKCEFYW